MQKHFPHREPILKSISKRAGFTLRRVFRRYVNPAHVEAMKASTGYSVTFARVLQGSCFMYADRWYVKGENMDVNGGFWVCWTTDTTEWKAFVDADIVFVGDFHDIAAQAAEYIDTTLVGDLVISRVRVR